MQQKISKSMVDRVPTPSSGQQIYWDTELKGFGLRVTPTRKTYVAQSRVAGRLVRTTVGLHGVFTPEEARKAAKGLLWEMATGIDTNRAKQRQEKYSVTLGEAFAVYKKSKTLADTTLRDYEESMKNGFKDWEDTPVRSITRDMVEDRFDKLSEVSHARTNLKFRFLRALLNFAMEKFTTDEGEPLIPSNPCNRLKALSKWHRIPRRTRHIAPEFMHSLLLALEHEPDDSDHRKSIKDFCAFILLTGSREQEAARLRWNDIDFNKGTVTFARTKNGDPHTLPLGSWNLGMLRRRRAETMSFFVFPADNKHGHLKNHLKGIIAINKASECEFRLHDLRRTFASVVNHHLPAHFSQYTIKRLLNHRSADVTAGYIQLTADDLRGPMEMVEAFVRDRLKILTSNQTGASARSTSSATPEYSSSWNG